MQWRFAVTRPDNPHSYTLRRHTDLIMFQKIVLHTREFDYQQRWWGTDYTMYRADGHHMWTMGVPLEATILINRKTDAQVGEDELAAVEDEATAARRIEAARGPISSYTPVHTEWYEDPDAVMPWEVLTHGAGPEDRRRAYRRYGARFEIDGEGELTLKLDLNLDGGIMSLTSTR